ncbi:hypothetical protein [Methylobacterium tardum]|nr:hypothetical protein [Methylobacterium tardum]
MNLAIKITNTTALLRTAVLLINSVIAEPKIRFQSSKFRTVAT